MFEKEPLSGDSPLPEFDNVALMQHSASYSDLEFQLLPRRAGESAVDELSGYWPGFVASLGVRPCRHCDS